MRIVAAVFLTLLATAAGAAPRPDALTLLKNASQRYADAKTYHIEAVEERTFSNEFSRNWEKQILVAIVGPDGKYRYDGKSGNGSGISASDGKTRWAYHQEEHMYTQTSTSASTDKNRVIMGGEAAILRAKQLVSEITGIFPRIKSATLLRDQTVEVNRRKIKCFVMHIGSDDYRTRQPDVKREETLWIEQSSLTIVKTENHEDSFAIMPPSGVHIPLRIDSTMVYPVVRLDETEPPSSFVFTPPADARLVEAFSNSMIGKSQGNPSGGGTAADFVGKQAPEIQLKNSDGKVTALSALRGKAVFIEFWATWCAPCVALIPDLKKLSAETSNAVTWISIDSDEDPGSATAYLAQERISWANYHDEDGALGKAFGREGIPLGVLIDQNGNVAFYKVGYDIGELHAAIAKLSPQVQGPTSSAAK